MKSRATFRLFGDETLTAAAVTRRLGIQPTRAFEAGNPVSSRSSDRRSLQRLLGLPGDLWLDIAGDEADVD
jgi:hypothetical protein